MLNNSKPVEPATRIGIARPRHGGSRTSWTNLLNLVSVGRWGQLVTAAAKGRCLLGLAIQMVARRGGGGAGLFTEAPSRAPERARGEQFGTLKGPQEMTCSSSVDAPFSLTGLKKRLISVGDEMALRSVAANGRGLPRGSPSHCQLQESEDQRAS